MGLIKGIANVIKEKAKEELVTYIKKVMEEEKEADKKEKSEQSKKTDFPAQVLSETKISETKEETKKIELGKKEIAKEEVVAPLIDDEIVKITIERKSDEIAIDRKFSSTLQMLPIEEFALYMKLYFFVFTQKKNFGYIGNTLKKKLELDSMSQEKFDTLFAKLEKRALLKTEILSSNQSIFVLYLPFDEEFMKKAEEPKKKETEKESEKEELLSKKQSVKTKKSEKIEEKEAIEESNEDEENLRKQYKTFVAMEIDKAKMRVGRSNFDKIYMEAVKYIDKKYGFSVLSDSEKFKEYLTQYYISAFDIPTFEEWKK